MLAGCADYGPGYYGPGPGGPVAYNAYYDGFYGPIYDGYWRGGEFYYRSRGGGQWHRGGGDHFRHTAANGYNRIQGATQSDNPRDHRNNTQ